MKHLLSMGLSVTLLCTVPAAANAMGEDDPLLLSLIVDQLEYRDTDEGNILAWEADAWIGKDLNKLWFKLEGERANGEGLEESELEVYYSRAVHPYWDFQAGWRRDSRPNPKRDWLGLGFKGLAPYFFETDAKLYLGNGGRSAIRLNTEYEFMFTQKLVFVPEFELNLHGKNDPGTGTGRGLSDMSLGLRLRYEIKREFAPYIGIHWVKKFGQTADYAREEDHNTSDLQMLAGIRFWF